MARSPKLRASDLFIWICLKHTLQSANRLPSRFINIWHMEVSCLKTTLGCPPADCFLSYTRPAGDASGCLGGFYLIADGGGSNYGHSSTR